MKKSILILFFICSNLFVLFAHPHVYIDMEMSLDFDDRGLKGIWQSWTLLRNFSPDIITDYDKDKNGFFDKEEQKDIYNKAFLGATPYYYFTFINIDDQEHVSLETDNFTAVIQGDSVVYSFYIPARIFATKESKILDIVTYDPTTYVSFGFAGLRDPLNENLDYSVDIVRDGGIYSHRNDLGQLRIIIDLKLSSLGLKNKSLSNEEKDIDKQLKSLDDVAPVPTETTSNPFLIKGVWSQSDKRANPFLSNN